VDVRPSVRGKFLFVGDEKYWSGASPTARSAQPPTGTSFPAADQVERDFAQMAAAGLNSVRVYTPPPRWLARRRAAP